MEIVAFSLSGHQPREDFLSPKGWDEEFGPRSDTTHIDLFQTLEEEYAPVSQFMEWLHENEEFYFATNFILRTRWDIYTKEQKIQTIVRDLWLQWFKKAKFVSKSNGGEYDLKDTLQYMCDVGFHINWTNDEQRMFVTVAKLNRKYGRSRGSTARSKGAVKRFADKLRIDLREKNTHAIMPGIQYGEDDGDYYTDNYNEMLREAKKWQSYNGARFRGMSKKKWKEWSFNKMKGSAFLKIREENMAIKADIGYFSTDLDRDAFIADYYYELLGEAAEGIDVF